MNRFELLVTNEFENTRVDKFISDNCEELTRSSVQKLIESNCVFVNKKVVSKNYKLKVNDFVEFDIPEPTLLEAVPQNIPVDIVYEDDDLLIVNKPKGMVVHPAAGNPDSTLVNALLYHCEGKLSSINGVIRPGIVHRIDKLTSGLLIVCKNDISHNFIAEQIKEHSFTREYFAINCGHFKEYKGTIDAPIGRDKFDRKKMCVTQQNSKNAVTHYEVLEEYSSYTLTKFTLETGRTHQIRVHSAYVGHPVLGDDVYGKAFKGIEGQCLHAKKVGFIHPTTKEYMEFDSELPEYFNIILNKIK
ncbi:MAG: RluA family pseudouridine synthase [Oscillospiraceae bacterium]|nr:RluA family pseudouridine synthase [Oscillospiraceae bacterium]